MSDLVKEISDAQKKPAVVDVRSGDTVRVYQKIQRVLLFELIVRILQLAALLFVASHRVSV